MALAAGGLLAAPPGPKPEAMIAPQPLELPEPSFRPGMGAIPYTGGTTFRIWAPNATAVAVAGTFNGWSTTANRLVAEGAGTWSADIDGVGSGAQYKFVLSTPTGLLWKNDPRARDMTGSVGNSVVRADTFDWSVYGPTVTLFSDGFESGSFGPAWTRTGEGAWRVQTSTTYRAAGTHGCTFDAASSGAFQTSRLTLSLNASGHSRLLLSYRIRNIADSVHPQDGVFISSDGVAWTKVDALPATSTIFTTRSVDLTRAAETAGIIAGPTFQVRWQEYDDGSLPARGIAIDDVTITGRAKSPAYSTPAWNDLVIYEMHIGTFNDTPGGNPGTFGTAIARLDQLQALGINAVEVMPVNEFPGDYSWGYNPSAPYTIEAAYGGMNEYKRFINECHARGIAVIQDVLHNHYGPNDMDLWRLDGWSQGGWGGIYFYNDSRAVTPWGNTRPDFGRGEVRLYIRDNAMLWLQEYRADGLRWDSTGNIRNTLHGFGTDIPEGWSLLQYCNNEIDAAQPWKISIAEDLQNNPWLTRASAAGGAGFDSQWDAAFVHPIRAALINASDSAREMFAVRNAIAHNYNGSAFQRVIYTESHDEVANGRSRVPEEIWPGNAGSYYSKKRSTLGAAIVMTAPGIPMIFQGQEILENGFFADTDPVDWTKLTTYAGIHTLYRDLIRLRRNGFDTTRGLRGNFLNVHHVNNTDKLIAYHRWQNGGPRDDVVIVANFANRTYTSYNLGFPRAGTWRVRFNSDWSGYSPDFGDTLGYDTVAAPGPRDGMNFNANVGIAPYSVLILSQDE